MVGLKISRAARPPQTKESPLRIAAGVILILTAVLNLIPALGYLAGGAVASAGGAAIEAAAAEAEKKGGSEMSAEDKAKLAEATKAIEGGGGGLMGYGILVLLSVVTDIVGAVFLFTQKKAKFVMVAGGIAILVEVVGAAAFTGFGIFKLVGIIGGVLALLAAKGFSAPGNASA